MEIKKFILGNTERTFRCYTSCPDEAGIELYTIINSALEQLNKLLDNTYSAYKNHFPQVTRPILYVYLREDDVANINAFTDGTDIYLSVAAMIGMDSYIRERLNTQKFNGEDLVPDDLRTTTQLRIYNYILELIARFALRMFTKFSRRAFVTTQKLDRLMAAAPNMGFSSQPNTGINKPAARGIPMVL